MSDKPTSVAHQQLAAFMRDRAGYDSATTYSVLAALEAHADLVGWTRVANEVIGIFPLLSQIDPDEWPNDTLEAWGRYLKAYLEKSDEFGATYPDINLLGSNVPKQKLGFIGTYPLYASLWYSTPKKYGDAYRVLQAHFVNACARFRDIERKDVARNYEPIRSLMGQVIRDIGVKDTDHGWLEDISGSATSTSALLAVAGNKKRDNKVSQNPWTVIERLLAFALQDRAGHAGGAGGYRGGVRLSVVGPGTDDNKSDIKKPKLHVYKTTRVSRREAQEAYIDGCAPDEIYSGTELVATTETLKTTRGESPISQSVRTREQYRYISAANQILPYRWGRLNLHDILVLLTGLRRLQDDPGCAPGSMSVDDARELTALLNVMYWTASSLERAANCRVVREISDLPKHIHAGDLYYCLKENYWAVGVVDLKQRKRASKDWAAYLRPVEKRVLLPAEAGSIVPLCSWLKIHYEQPGKRAKRLFRTEPTVLETRCSQFISWLNKESNVRLTQVRIQNHIFSLVIDRCGDMADACLMFARTPPSGLITALYYYAPSTKYLHDKYDESCREVVRAVYRAKGEEVPKTENVTKVEITGYVGSEICPTDELINRLVSDLKNNISAIQKNMRGRDYIPILHNAYTVYTVMMVAFATGYRAVRDPFCRLTDVDVKTEFLAISDKDDDDYFNSRLVWLPEVCRDQIKAYQVHRRRLGEHLSLVNPALSRALLKDGDDFYWPKKDAVKTEKPPLLFLLDSRWQIDGVGPRTLAEQLAWCYELPINANRHYLRTRLRELGVTGEIVDAFMGHWERGQEFHNRYSTLSPLDYKEAIAEPLTELMKRAGWTVLQGLGHE